MATVTVSPLRSCEFLKAADLTPHADDSTCHFYSGVVCSPGQRLLLVDFSLNNFKLYNRQTGEILAKSEKLGPLWDVCNIDKNRTCVAVTLRNGKIQIMSVQATGPTPYIRSLKAFKTPLESCRGVSAIPKHDKLVVSGIFESMQCWCVVSISNENVGTIHKICQFGGFGYSYLASSENEIYVYISCYADNSSDTGVYGYILESGERIFNYKRSDLSWPRGICADKRGFIYVCNQHLDRRNIHQLKENGEPLMIFKLELLPDPQAICLDENQENIFITLWGKNRISRFRIMWEDHTGPADAISSCKESATMPTSSPRPEDTSEVKVLKLQKSLKEMSTADDNGIQVCHLGRPSGSSAGNMRAQFNETESVFNQRVLVDLAKSIGIIKSPYGTFGTGFRVGCSYIMTAKHVKDYILNAVPSQLCKPVPPTRILHLNDAFIDFSYEVSIDDKQSIHTDDNHKFYFEPKIVYENDNMDTVILQLKLNMGMEFPPPLTAFAELSDPKGQLYLIGHSKAEIKRTDKFSGVQLTNEEKNSAKHWSERHIGIDGFTGIDNPQKVLFHCTFEKGASGSPGVWICNKNNPHAYIVIMLLCGYPEWFYHDDCPLEKKCIPHHHLVEQGVCMRSLCEDIKSTDPDLWQEIFCCNLPVSQNDDVEMKSM